jgi:RNA polymerase primary sigma factor
MLSTLSYRGGKVLKLRYGLFDCYVYTLDELGKLFCITKERARQIEARAVSKLQHSARKKMLEEFID